MFHVSTSTRKPMYITLFVLSLDTFGTFGDTSLLYDTYRESLRCASETLDTSRFLWFLAPLRRVITLSDSHYVVRSLSLLQILSGLFC